MAEQIEILVVEHSEQLRRSISATLNVHAEITAFGTSDDSAESLNAISKRSIDVVVIGVSPSSKKTTELLKKIRAADRHLPIILYASISLRAGTTALSALSAGASAHVGRPTITNSQQLADSINNDLMPAIKRWYRSTTALRKLKSASGTHRSSWKKKVMAAVSEQPRGAATQRASNLPSWVATQDDGVVVIGSSTGGIDALKKVLLQLPPDYGKPVVVVQHLLKGFGKLLSEGLAKQCKVPVTTPADGDELHRGQIYIAPPGNHLKLMRKSNGRIAVKLTDDKPVNSCKPAADVLFNSAAEVYGDKVDAIVLSGMGQDGTDGCRTVSKGGGGVLVQSRDTCVVWGMPRSIEEAGLADLVLSPEAIGRRLAAAGSLVPA